MFPPLWRPDNSLASEKLKRVGQVLPTELAEIHFSGFSFGDVRVAAIKDNGWTFTAMPGHPLYPGTVSFLITEVNGNAVLTVSGESDHYPIPGGLGKPGYDAFSAAYWSLFAVNISSSILGTYKVEPEH